MGSKWCTECEAINTISLSTCVPFLKLMPPLSAWTQFWCMCIFSITQLTLQCLFRKLTSSCIHFGLFVLEIPTRMWTLIDFLDHHTLLCARFTISCFEENSLVCLRESQVLAPSELTVLMGAQRSTPSRHCDEPEKPSIHFFHQDIPIPSYLVALACGELEHA